MYAIIQTGGKQYKVSEGDELIVDQVTVHEGKTMLFPVLLVADDTNVLIGQPEVKDAQVQATVIHHEKGKKIRVSTYKAKSNYHRTIGFRARLSKIKVDRIDYQGKKIQPKKAVDAEPKGRVTIKKEPVKPQPKKRETKKKE